MTDYMTKMSVCFRQADKVLHKAFTFLSAVCYYINMIKYVSAPFFGRTAIWKGNIYE